MSFTIVTGLWQLDGHQDRGIDHYVKNFNNLLQLDFNFVIFTTKDIQDQLKLQSNHQVRLMNPDNLKELWSPNTWNQIQNIRTSPEWIGQAGWLKTSPQYISAYYSLMTYSKIILLHQIASKNPFGTDYFYWVDAGITNTVNLTYLQKLKDLPALTDPSLFIAFPYRPNQEIHGMSVDWIRTRVDTAPDIWQIPRGGIFGGTAKFLGQIVPGYKKLVTQSLEAGKLGTEESIFTILALNSPHVFHTNPIGSHGLLYEFFDKIPQPIHQHSAITNVYVLTFNFPEQLKLQVESMNDNSDILRKSNIYIFDNSTSQNAINKNRALAESYKFRYIHLGKNTGICGARQRIAEHFHASHKKYMIFFEDDMTLNPKSKQTQFCRNGLRLYVDNLLDKLIGIMDSEELDFLKLNFTEVFMDNHLQCSWYNVPQHVREKYWPDNPTIPPQPFNYDDVTPPTNFSCLKRYKDLLYAVGDAYYSNWPIIINQSGNEKIFIETKWAHPYEQTWMSHVFQKIKEKKIMSAVLLASPILHKRIQYYDGSERREN